MVSRKVSRQGARRPSVMHLERANSNRSANCLLADSELVLLTEVGVGDSRIH